jgi:hypothetical protein
MLAENSFIKIYSTNSKIIKMEITLSGPATLTLDNLNI